MGIFDQMKMASELMKNMNPDQMKEMMEQAQKSQGALMDQVRKVIDEEVKKRNLISRDEVLKMIREIKG